MLRGYVPPLVFLLTSPSTFPPRAPIPSNLRTCVLSTAFNPTHPRTAPLHCLDADVPSFDVTHRRHPLPVRSSLGGYSTRSPPCLLCPLSLRRPTSSRACTDDSFTFTIHRSSLSRPHPDLCPRPHLCPRSLPSPPPAPTLPDDTQSIVAVRVSTRRMRPSWRQRTRNECGGETS